MCEAFCGGLDSLNAGDEITFTKVHMYIYVCIHAYMYIAPLCLRLSVAALTPSTPAMRLLLPNCVFIYVCIHAYMYIAQLCLRHSVAALTPQTLAMRLLLFKYVYIYVYICMYL